MDTPCPPYYAEPTHEQTLLFSTSSYVRRGEEWYQCLEGAYCNAPSFLGYNPPGEGDLWWQAWTRLDEGYPCNAELEESSSRGNGASATEESGTSDLFKVTNKPTNRPTRPEEAPSLISGAVWYDANGDGRKNTLSNAQTRTDYDAASKERGAGMSNVQITLRDCKTDELVGVTYTFPRSFGLGGEGAVEVVDASYLESMQSQGGQDAILNDGLGIGNSEGKLGYYSFRILPFQLPGEFYVVMEAPEGYRLTGGSGEYWEVYEAALHDNVQPLMEAPWLKSEQGTGNRALQGGNNATATGGTALQGNAQDKPPERPKGPIKHSGHLARSGCIPIEKSPARVTGMDAGLALDSWPLRPYQYASLVVTIKFYNFGGRRRNLLILESLECRKYKKLLSEGIEVEDIWGCEAGGIGGTGGPLIEYVELTLDEGDIVVASLKEFLDSRVSRVWTIRSISIAHQKMTNLDYNGGGGGRRLGARQLQVNREVAQLELGLRIRAEFSSDRGNTDLADVIASSIRNGKDSLLSVWKGLPANAGELEVRDILWQPAPKKPVVVEEDPVVEEAAAVDDVPITASEYQQEDAASENSGVSAGLIAGVVAGLVAILAIVAGLLIYRRRTKKGSGGDDESSQPAKKESKGLKWWQRQNSKKKGASKAKKKKMGLGRRPAKKNELEGSSEEEESSYDDDDDDFDDLSSRWFSDSSKYDPETRMKEVDDHFDVHSQAYSESTGYSRRLSDGSGSRSSFNSGSIGSYDSGYSSRTPSGRSRRSRQNPLRSSGRTNRSSMTSARSSMNSIALQESGLYSIREAASLEASSAEYSSSKGSYSTRDSRNIQADSSSSRGDSSADYSSSRGSYSTRDSRGDSSADYNSSMGSSANYSSSRGSYSTRDSRAKRKSRTRRVT